MSEGAGRPSSQTARRGGRPPQSSPPQSSPPPTSAVCGIDGHEPRYLQDRDPLRPSFVAGVILSVLMGELLLCAEGAVSIDLLGR